MRLWTGKPTDPSTKEPWTGMQWRWTLDVGRLDLGFYLQSRHPGEEFDYRGALPYAFVAVNRSFRLGQEHGWYDGPHCSLSLGYLHFSWSLYSCDKCSEEE